MDLQHEDILIKLRSKLNNEKIKLWESPYLQPDNTPSKLLQDLARKYADNLLIDFESAYQALLELQVHSIDRSKANEEYKDTGLATLRVKSTLPGGKPNLLRIQKRLNIKATELIAEVAKELEVDAARIKLIVNGKVIKTSLSLEEQGIKNGALIMALIMAENPETIKKEDKLYSEVKNFTEDALLLSETADHIEDDEYMKLEDQSGQPVDLPQAERRALLVGLALHERGRAAAKQRDYTLALILLLEADRQLNECSSSILKTVDNWAVLQLDIAWCYLCLQNLSSASDAATRLQRAEESFKNTYGENHQRLIALKGTNANERVLIMRLYLLQGIVAYHQNKREEAKRLLDLAENELSYLKVDENSVQALMELGWSEGGARSGLRAAAGDLDRAHLYLAERKQEREKAREKHRLEREHRVLGLCVDGSSVNSQLVEALVSMGYGKKLATLALRNSNNHVAEAVRLIQEQPELLADSDLSSEERSKSSDESYIEPDNKVIAEMEAMGYDAEEAKKALKLSWNNVDAAVELLVTRGGKITNEDACNPSTSSGKAVSKQKNERREKRKQRRKAFNRLTSAIHVEVDDHLDASLAEEEEFLVQYKSLL